MSEPLPKQCLPALLLARAEALGEAVAFRRPAAGEEGSWSYGRFARLVRGLGTAFLARGLRRGDRVALISGSRREWFLADLALTGAGAVDVPRDTDTSLPELLAILRHAGPRWLIAEKEETAREILRRRKELPGLEKVLLLGPGGGDPGLENLADLATRGEGLLTRGDRSFAEALAALTPSDLLTIVYTSGTTAEPRGVMLTHANLLANVVRLPQVHRARPGDRVLSLLPCWHVFERTIDYYMLAHGAEILFSDKRRFRRDLADVKPHFMVSVPRIWEALHDAVDHNLAVTTGFFGRVARAAARIARRRGEGRPAPVDRLLAPLLLPLLRRRLARSLGGRLRCAVSGGGALPFRVDAFFTGAGLPLLQGYGLTETSPVVCCRRLDCNRPGGSGTLLSDTEVEIRDGEGRPLPPGEKGVVHVRGPQVTPGYYRNEAATARAIDGEGWLDTGDLGMLDERGELHIRGRAKETIVLAGGENVEPAPLEEAICSSPMVRRAVLVGQDRKHLAAFIVPDREQLVQAVPEERWEHREGLLEGKAVTGVVRAELDRICQDVNGFRPHERVARFKVLAEDFSCADQTLTPTLKIRRHKVVEKYGHLFEEM